MLCEVCGTWQHQLCYGWDKYQSSCPTDHFCYSCLLLPEEKDLNDWMPILVGCRNALRYIHSSPTPLATDEAALIEAMRMQPFLRSALLHNSLTRSRL
jgi:disulfide oxidoreductase YuzD